MRDYYTLKLRFSLFSLLVLSVFFSGCFADSSPLRSDIENAINKTYGMDFGYLDQVQVFHNGEEIRKIQGESVRHFILLLAKATKTEEKDDLPKDAPYEILLSTSQEGLQFNKNQTSAELHVFLQGKDTYLRYNNQLFKLSESLSSYGIE